MKEGTKDKQFHQDDKESKSPAPPSISLPKGGGAIRGIGEKFGTNPVTGTASITIPIATSPGRSGFGPQLSLSYDSGSGNGPFGFGWHLSLPVITRKTDKGIPQYRDADESDVFIMSGAEDLVPELQKDAAGHWVMKEGSHVIYDRTRTIDRVNYAVRRYRPRIEGLFAFIERWTNEAEPSEIFWRSISKDNVTTWYGRTEESRIFDPQDKGHIFSWLICESYDDKGNAIAYEYLAENDENVDWTQANERNRMRTANRYLKRIRYGNHEPYMPKLSANEAWPALPAKDEWFFEVVFDYGEHDRDTPAPKEPGKWPLRADRFSSYRSGFEIRTYRLCRRVLMFHHIPDPFPDPSSGEKGYDGLVRSTDFTYSCDKEPTNPRNPVYSFLLSVTQTGYKLTAEGRYLSRSLPPVEFEYTEPIVQETVEEVDPASLENLPTGLDGAVYQWTDLHGEGIPGILTEQADAWFYKRNLSPISNGQVEFAPLEHVAVKPALSLAGGARFMDLAGDGRPDLVVMDGPMPGLYEHDGEEGWDSFRPFMSHLNRNMCDPNLKFVDLDGDGYADVLITEDDAFVWHASLAEEGFGPGRRIAQAMDEEKGGRLVFADGTESIYLADLGGDGLTDLVRVRNGEICYWPNLGYGRFGAKVTMDNAPCFDHPDQFEQERIRLADIDGSGTTDIVYLHGEGVRLYFNQSGNSWSEPHVLPVFPRADELVSIVATDLLGNGTACLVWSSPLPGDARRPMRYVNLMGGQKPHLLVRTVNNLGTETHVQYAPSTKFYLQDKQNGTPWVTRLPFPVHCVEKTTVTDKWRNTRFSMSYSYHHGYFDGVEREFRGFGRVEEVDVETYGEFRQGNEASPYITHDKTLYQPPVKTVTWHHTGAYIDRERLLSHFSQEYFQPAQEHNLREQGLQGADLTAEEWREALRACKGMMLRQEVYELDIDALESGSEVPIKLLSTAFHNCDIELLQPKAASRHAVFHVTESETMACHYELDLRQTEITPDPRIVHTLNLRTDEYGNVQQSVAAVYRRAKLYSDNTLPPEYVALINQIQNEVHLTYTENRYTDDNVHDDDNHRLPAPCQSRNYEVTGIEPINGYFSLEQLRGYELSDFYRDDKTPLKEAVTEIRYHEIADGNTPRKRLVEEARTLYFDESLKEALTFGKLNRLGLPYETYRLALTDTLLADILRDKLTTEVQGRLSDSAVSGYLSGDPLTARLGNDTSGQYWMRSGIAGFADDAAQHFYLPERYTDPFGSETILNFDKYNLYIESNTDALGNKTAVERFDFRVLAPMRIKDINDNLSEVHFDILGMPTAMALKGKGSEADNLDDFDRELADPDAETLIKFFTGDYREDDARRLLGNATARHLYYFGEKYEADGSITWGAHPAGASGILRETHVTQLEQGEQAALQTAFEYSDGMGSVLLKKAQAEPEADGGKLRWIATGRIILNNKGNPVKQYEPYFSQSDHRFEEPVEVGVTPVMYYDAVGRLIRTELPDGSCSRVEFSPWHVTSFDPNDTVMEPDNVWYARMTSGTASSEEKRAAALTAVHAATPSVTILDSLGRDVITVTHNRTEDSAGPISLNGMSYRDEKYFTFTKLDAEGKPLWIRDDRGNLAMQYIFPVKADNDPGNEVPTGSVTCYDTAGNLLFQHSMDAGNRWMLNDAAGKPMYNWDSRNNMLCTTYDTLHRPIKLELRNDTHQDWIVVGYTHYGEDVPDNKARNLRGRIVRAYDQSGLIKNERFDFKGNAVEMKRRLADAFDTDTDWRSAVGLPPDQEPDEFLMDEAFTQINEYDALNRITRQYSWHKEMGGRVAVYQPKYNERGLFSSEDVVINATKTATGVVKGLSTPIVKKLTYNEKGQRLGITYGNNATTTYEYDPETFRLIHVKTQRQSDDKTLQELRYTYDPSGNITEINDNAQPTIFFNNVQIDARNLYSYDALYRLIKAEGREHAGQVRFNEYDNWNDCFFRRKYQSTDTMAWQNYTERYEYDSVGNIASIRHMAQGDTADSWTRQYQYARSSNRLLATGMGAAPVERYVDTPTLEHIHAYNAHGSMSNLPHLPAIDWDFTEHLGHIARAAGTQGGDPDECADTSIEAWYRYDATRRRTRKRIIKQGGAVEERIYLGGFEIYREYNGSGTGPRLERETLHIMDGTQRIALIETKTLDVDAPQGMLPENLIRYQLGNHLGSAILELDELSQIVSYEEYHPYGTTAYQAVNKDVKSAAKRYRYTGKERDGESGFYYHGARYYAPWLGTWTSCDPAGTIDGFNLYSYVLANPIKLEDHTGYQAGPESRVMQWIELQKRRKPPANTSAPDQGPPPATAGSRPEQEGVKESKGVDHPSVFSAQYWANVSDTWEYYNKEVLPRMQAEYDKQFSALVAERKKQLGPAGEFLLGMGGRSVEDSVKDVIGSRPTNVLIDVIVPQLLYWANPRPPTTKAPTKVPAQVFHRTDASLENIHQSRLVSRTEGSVYASRKPSTEIYESGIPAGKGKKLVIFEGEAVKEAGFRAHPIEGPYSLWKRIGGQYKAGFGDLEILESELVTKNMLVVTKCKLVPPLQPPSIGYARLWSRRLLWEGAATAGLLGAAALTLKGLGLLIDTDKHGQP